MLLARGPEGQPPLRPSGTACPSGPATQPAPLTTARSCHSRVGCRPMRDRAANSTMSTANPSTGCSTRACERRVTPVLLNAERVDEVNEAAHRRKLGHRHVARRVLALGRGNSRGDNAANGRPVSAAAGARRPPIDGGGGRPDPGRRGAHRQQWQRGRQPGPARGTGEIQPRKGDPSAISTAGRPPAAGRAVPRDRVGARTGRPGRATSAGSGRRQAPGHAEYRDPPDQRRRHPRSHRPIRPARSPIARSKYRSPSSTSRRSGRTARS